MRVGFRGLGVRVWMIQRCRQRTTCQSDAAKDHEVNQVNVLVEQSIEIEILSELQRRKWREKKPRPRKEKRYALLIVSQDFSVAIAGFGDV
jgi:hypothetical protein